MEEAISAADANRKFSLLLRGVRAGRSYVVTSHGKPVARVIFEAEYEKLMARRRKGAWPPPVLDTRGFRFDREEANRR